MISMCVMMMKCVMFYICCAYVVEGLFHTKNMANLVRSFFFPTFFKKRARNQHVPDTTFPARNQHGPLFVLFLLFSLYVYIWNTSILCILCIFRIFHVFHIFCSFSLLFRCKKCKEVFLRTLIDNSCPLGY
jgi:hypothetical protein